jgi:hypothetical protein
MAMAYDYHLAELLRDALSKRSAVIKRKMFSALPPK